MSALINRVPTGRLISLQAELKYLDKKYNKNQFTLNGMKYDSTSKLNQLLFFPLAKTDRLGIYDPYLDNRLSRAGFHLTQSIQYDSQKSKSASECLNALQALGWVEQEGRSAKVSSLGKQVAAVSYCDRKFLELARNSVLGYGVFVGFLYKVFSAKSEHDMVKRDDIKIGYVNTHETVRQAGRDVPLSTGSQKDTIVRTRSTLFAWAITTGFALPIDHLIPKDKSLWHVETLDIISKEGWIWNRLRVFVTHKLFNKQHYVDRPLSYAFMTKSTKALRERGQAQIRTASLSFERRIKNRRFAIVYGLGVAAEKGKNLNFPNFIERLRRFQDLFVVVNSDFDEIMDIEKDIAITSGIPFLKDGDVLKPLTKINLSELKIGAPEEVVSALKTILNTPGVLE
jgi:hypothetical protein